MQSVKIGVARLFYLVKSFIETIKCEFHIPFTHKKLQKKKIVYIGMSHTQPSDAAIRLQKFAKHHHFFDFIQRKMKDAGLKLCVHEF